jgi:DNA modification methylase
VNTPAPCTIQLPVGDDPPSATLHYGRDNRDVLSRMSTGSVHTVVTSPPYWGLRNYGTPPLVFGGRKGCGHKWGDPIKSAGRGSAGSKSTLQGTQSASEPKKATSRGVFCKECGAWRGDLGLEPSPEMFVEHLVEVFREVHRVLRDDGTMWVNIGDTYAASPDDSSGIKPKDLVGIPWRLALALQSDGWWLRNSIIWHKANHLPTPIKDRLAASYEFIFLFTKSKRYYFNLDAIRVPHTYGAYDEEGNFAPAQTWNESGEGDRKMDQTEGHLGPMAGSPRRQGRGLYNSKGKNPGDVWKMPTQPFPGAHFAVFPPGLPERCIRAGTSAKGVCPSCQTPWHLVKEYGEREDTGASSGIAPELEAAATRSRDTSGKGGNVLAARPVLSEEWMPACDCGIEEAARATVLDPFSGSGTTGMVALELGHDYVGIDLNPDYLPMATCRVVGDKPPSEPPPVEEGSVLDLFGS